MLQLFQIKVSLLKKAKNLKKLLKIRWYFYPKKLVSLIVRMRTNRGSTVVYLIDHMNCFFQCEIELSASLIAINWKQMQIPIILFYFISIYWRSTTTITKKFLRPRAFLMLLAVALCTWSLHVLYKIRIIFDGRRNCAFCPNERNRNEANFNRSVLFQMIQNSLHRYFLMYKY